MQTALDLGVRRDRLERGAQARRDAAAANGGCARRRRLAARPRRRAALVAGDQPHRMEPRLHGGVERPGRRGAGRAAARAAWRRRHRGASRGPRRGSRSRPLVRSPGDRPGPAALEVDAQQHASFALHRGAVVVPVGVLARGACGSSRRAAPSRRAARAPRRCRRPGSTDRCQPSSGRMQNDTRGSRRTFFVFTAVSRVLTTTRAVAVDVARRRSTSAGSRRRGGWPSPRGGAHG